MSVASDHRAQQTRSVPPDALRKFIGLIVRVASGIYLWYRRANHRILRALALAVGVGGELHRSPDKTLLTSIAVVVFALLKIRRDSWAFARFALAVALLLCVASMLLYPGGTVLSESTRGYSFAHNFLSDLGSTVTLSGQRNAAGAALMAVSVIIGVLVLAASFVASVRLLSPTPGARGFARLAAVAGALVCAGYLGVALTPIDRAPRLHGLSTLVACHSFPVATALLAIATSRDRRFRRRAVAGWLILTVVLAGFIAIAYLGPSGATEGGLIVQVITQKVMAATVLVVLWVESYEAEAASASAPRHATDRVFARAG